MNRLDAFQAYMDSLIHRGFNGKIPYFHGHVQMRNTMLMRLVLAVFSSLGRFDRDGLGDNQCRCKQKFNEFFLT